MNLAKFNSIIGGGAKFSMGGGWLRGTSGWPILETLFDKNLP